MPYFLLLLFAFGILPVSAQSVFERQPPLMNIPKVLAMETSGIHLYILSDDEGLVVFRAHSDSLQWQYTSTGMEKRGHKLRADARFAYIYGDMMRLSIIEPTSMLGVYSSTILPAEPVAVHRIGNYLYIAMGEEGLARISLSTPESVDESFEDVDIPGVEKPNVTDLTGTNSSLFLLSNLQQLYIFRDRNDSLTLDRRINLDRPTSTIHLFGEELFGTAANGAVFKIASDGRTREWAKFNSPVTKLDKWNDYLIARTLNQRLHVITDEGKSAVLAEVAGAGNHFVLSKGTLFTNEFERISILMKKDATKTELVESKLPKLKIKPIESQIIPFPRPVVIALETEPDFPQQHLQFHARALTNSIQIRGSGLFWQPSAQEIGMHLITVIGTSSDGQVDSTSFSVDVRPFNAPPRFFPLRPISIAVNEPFTVTISAIDPDGPNRDLIRYVALDLPEGASLDERTGQFNWKPDRKAVGTHKFQIIATDQYGAAAAQQVSITVIEASRN